MATWLVALLSVAGLPAAADEGPAASAGIAAQERARALAAELVRGVIDVQLRQLEENGLADRPIFADIESLRGVVDALVQREMPDVIDLLGRAEGATPAERPALVTEARTRARGIVTRLAAERQQILRRLKEATLAAQARAVVDRQKRLLAATESLPTLPDGRREQAMLAAIEEERNIQTLVATLQAALDDVGRWGGEIGATGLAGLRALEQEGVPEAVAAAEGRLAQADPVGAAAAERRAIAGLEAVLATVEGKRATRPADAAATAAKEAAALGSRAAEMRREMAKVPLTDESVEKLLAEQSALQESLATLADELRGEPAAALVEEAREASLEAAAGLLEGDQRRAVAEQDAVIERLAEVAARLDAAGPATAPASAEEFAKRAAELMDVLRKVEEFARRQDEISRAAAQQPQAAAGAERQLAAAVAELAANDTRDTMPSPVEQRLAAAADAAAKAAEAPTPQAAQSALAAATDALQAAAREIAQAVADAKRAELAAKAGELSRAAEVTERAAAAERQIAEGAKQAGATQRDGTPRPDGERSDASAGEAARSPAEPLAAQQAEVAAIAEKVEDAVDGLAPEAAQMVAAAQAAMRRPARNSKPARPPPNVWPTRSRPSTAARRRRRRRRNKLHNRPRYRRLRRTGPLPLRNLPPNRQYKNPLLRLRQKRQHTPRRRSRRLRRRCVRRRSRPPTRPSRPPRESSRSLRRRRRISPGRRRWPIGLRPPSVASPSGPRSLRRRRRPMPRAQQMPRRVSRSSRVRPRNWQKSWRRSRPRWPRSPRRWKPPCRASLPRRRKRWRRHGRRSRPPPSSSSRRQMSTGSPRRRP
ncbi:MAG: hypothetical protein ACKO6B_08680 [Planctomycetia bacterium]